MRKEGMVFPRPLVVTHSKHQGPFKKSEPIKINMTGQYHPHGIMSAFHWMYAVSLKALKGLRHNACTSSHYIIWSHTNQNTPVYDTQAVPKKCCLFICWFLKIFIVIMLYKMLVSGHYAATAGLTDASSPLTTSWSLVRVKDKVCCISRQCVSI